MAVRNSLRRKNPSGSRTVHFSDGRVVTFKAKRNPKHDYEVYVGNLGCVHRGSSKKEADTTYAQYVKASKSGSGRAGGEGVQLMVDGEPVKEHFGTNEEWNDNPRKLKRRKNPAGKAKWQAGTHPYNLDGLEWTGAAPGDRVEVSRFDSGSLRGRWLPYVQIGNQRLGDMKACASEAAAKRAATTAYTATKPAWDRAAELRAKKANPRRRKTAKRRNPGKYCVVKFSSPSDVEGKVLSCHETLAAAQKAHKDIVMPGTKLIPGYLSYGITEKATPILVGAS
jgi:hypothetical protein